ncbi:MAG: TolC family protein, partial [Oscillospiraceae bacterium]|nr:TolC family protein [Oscillospiraceae bacterium]
GTISDLELDQFAANVLNAQNSVNSQERELEVAMLGLKNTIGYPLDKELKISGEFSLPAIDPTKPGEAVEKSLTNVTVTELNDAYDLNKYYFELNERWYSSNQPQYHTAKANFNAATQQYENNINQNTISVFTAYNAMVSAYEALDYLNTQLELSEKNVEVQKLRYDMGMITALDYLEAVNNLAELELSISETSLNAYIASLNYRALYDCTDTSDIGERVETKNK